tara:strand:- start:10 stop:240 length:231 start_codon:yes stop_codon:yes gene_type:complete
MFEILHFNSFIKKLFTSHPISPSEIVMIVLKDGYICSAQATLFNVKGIFRKVMLEGNPCIHELGIRLISENAQNCH